MYKIIGADQKEYGPIPADQLRQWIAQGRVNAQTQVLAEGAAEWRALGTYPEFADALAAGAPGRAPIPMQAQPNRETAAQAVKGPAIGLIVAAGVGLLMVVVNVITVLVGGAGPQELPPGMPPEWESLIENFYQFSPVFSIVQNAFAAIVGLVILIGAIKMLKLESHGFAFTASILAMVPCLSPCCLLGLPFGIWALVVLNKPEVKSQFT